jgi:ATP-dependent Clp protease, protease subunit
MEQKIIRSEEEFFKEMEIMDNNSMIKLVDDVIYFNAEICDKSSFDFSILLHKQQKAKEKMVDKNQVIFLTTPGGDVNQGLQLHDFLKKSTLDIHVIISSFVASAGTLMMCGAKKISIYENAYLMVHELSGSFNDRFHSNEVAMKFHADLMAKMIKIYCKRTGKASIITNDWLKIDNYFDAKDALEFGLVDEII